MLSQKNSGGQEIQMELKYLLNMKLLIRCTSNFSPKNFWHFPQITLQLYSGS